MVEKDGKFVLVAVVTSGDTLERVSWPPPCVCCLKEEPEINVRVSAFIPWINEIMKKNNANFDCQRKI